MKKRLVLMVLFFLVLAPSLLADVVSGQPAPDFKLPDSNGQSRALADYRGKFVVLEWFNPECPFVHKHYDSHNMQDLQKEYTGKGVVWLTINSAAPGKQGYCTAEDANQVTENVDAHSTAVLLDPAGEVGRLYGAKTTPHIFIIDPSGTLIYQGAIDDHPSPYPEDIPKAKNYVRLTLDAAMANQPVAISSTKSYGCSVKYQ